MDIKAKCKYDYESIKALTHFSLFKRANPKKRIISLIIIFSALTLLVLLKILLSRDTDLLIYLCILIVVLLIENYLYFIVPKLRYRSLAKLKDSENEYVFSDKILRINNKSQDYSGESNIEYSFFVKVYETSRYLFLYQTNNLVFIVDIDTLEGGTIEDIRNIFSECNNGKYIICNY